MRMSRCSECYNKTAPQDSWSQKVSMKAVTEDEPASHDDEVALSVLAPIVDIATFMKQPFTEVDFLEEE